MKLMVISDIHGGTKYLNKAIEKYKEEGTEKLLVLGDFGGYVHSSSDYEVGEILNNMAGAVIAVKGNCDSTYTDEIFHFPMPYLRSIEMNNIKITMSHGHMYNPQNLPEDCGDIFLFGHTHRGMIEKQRNIIIGNAGSITRPLGGTKRSYLIIDENNICLKDLDGNLIKEMKIKSGE